MEGLKKKYITSKEKQKEYHNTFMINNKDKIHEKLVCNICGANYTYFNKSRHNKSTKHKLSLEIKTLKNNS